MTPFSKVKTWIKQGFYEKLPSSKSLRGALDLQQEILDSLIREKLLVTSDCCNYYVKVPIVTAEGDSSIPDGVIYLVNLDEGVYVPVVNVNGEAITLTIVS